VTVCRCEPSVGFSSEKTRRWYPTCHSAGERLSHSRAPLTTCACADAGARVRVRVRVRGQVRVAGAAHRGVELAQREIAAAA